MELTGKELVDLSAVLGLRTLGHRSQRIRNQAACIRRRHSRT